MAVAPGPVLVVAQEIRPVQPPAVEVAIESHTLLSIREPVLSLSPRERADAIRQRILQLSGVFATRDDRMAPTGAYAYCAV